MKATCRNSATAASPVVQIPSCEVKLQKFLKHAVLCGDAEKDHEQIASPLAPVKQQFWRNFQLSAAAAVTYLSSFPPAVEFLLAVLIAFEAGSVVSATCSLAVRAEHSLG